MDQFAKDSFVDTRPAVITGSGPTLVFLHYYSGAASSWKRLAEMLPDHRCVCLNLPGFGGTHCIDDLSLDGMIDFVRRELDRMQIERCGLIGHSMGGKIAMGMAANDDRNRIEWLGLIATSPATTEDMSDSDKQRLLQHHPSRQNALQTVTSSRVKPLVAGIESLAIKTHMMTDHRVWKWWLSEGMNHSIADRMNRIKIPVHVLASSDDPVIPIASIQSDVVDLITTAKLTTLSGVGHLIPLEEPETVADWIFASAVKP